ncbi:MAG: hypothetical protein U0232_14820 [Thermomicrobiales bacterium]
MTPEIFAKEYASVFRGRPLEGDPVPVGSQYQRFDPDSTYVQEPPFLFDLSMTPGTPGDIIGAPKVLGVFGDSVTPRPASPPAGSIARDSAASDYLTEHDVPRAEYNSYGARRGNPAGDGARAPSPTSACATS